MLSCEFFCLAIAYDLSLIEKYLCFNNILSAELLLRLSVWQSV